MNYDQWVATLPALGASNAVWPPKFQDGNAGLPAARFTADAYVAAFNAGQLPTGAGTMTDQTPTGQYVYVLAHAMTGDTTVDNTSPHTMTLAERAANAAFGTMDNAADALGLPSLSGIESMLKGIGTNVLIGVVVTVIVAQVLRGRR